MQLPLAAIAEAFNLLRPPRKSECFAACILAAATELQDAGDETPMSLFCNYKLKTRFAFSINVFMHKKDVKGSSIGFSIQ